MDTHFLNRALQYHAEISVGGPEMDTHYYETERSFFGLMQFVIVNLARVKMNR